MMNAQQAPPYTVPAEIIAYSCQTRRHDDEKANICIFKGHPREAVAFFLPPSLSPFLFRHHPTLFSILPSPSPFFCIFHDARRRLYRNPFTSSPSVRVIPGFKLAVQSSDTSRWRARRRKEDNHPRTSPALNDSSAELRGGSNEVG